MWPEPDEPWLGFPVGSVGRAVISGNGRYAAFLTMNTAIVNGE